MIRFQQIISLIDSGKWTLLILSVIAFLALSTRGAYAQDTTIHQTYVSTDDDREFSGQLNGSFSIGTINRAYHASVILATAINYQKVSGIFQVPLRFQLKIPKGETALRKADWDETSDFFKLLPLLEYGKPIDPLHVKLGDITGIKLGHGTIVDQYYSSINVDHYQSGAEFHWHFHYGGAEAFLDNIAYPNILGTRAYIRPLSFLFSDSLLNGLAIGVSIISDIYAPDQYKLDSTGKRIVTADREISTTNHAVVLTGIDLEWELPLHARFTLVPYSDFNFLNDKSASIHAGFMMNILLTPEAALFGQFEYRFMGAKYDPNYFDTMYEYERFQMSQKGTKYASVTSPDRKKRHGFSAAVGFAYKNMTRFEIRYDEAQGTNNGAFLIRGAFTLKPVELNGVIIKRNFDNPLTKDGLVVLTEARVNLYSILYAYGSFSRQWQLQTDGYLQGVFSCINDYSVGFEARFHF